MRKYEVGRYNDKVHAINPDLHSELEYERIIISKGVSEKAKNNVNIVGLIQRPTAQTFQLKKPEFFDSYQKF